MLFKKSIITGLSVAFGLLTFGVVSHASTYTVRQGDTVSEIAETQGTSINEIMNENQLSNLNVIYVGEKLSIGEQQVQQPVQQQTQEPVQQPTQQASQSNNQNYEASQPTGNVSSNSGVSGYAQEMASRTGVSASEWEAIIERESGGSSTAQNPSSSAHGILQQLGETSNDPQTQINDAVKLYDEQGLNAWSETR